MPSKVLFLLSNTGSGHRASAEALQAEFAHSFGSRFTTTAVDLLCDHLIWPINRLPASYPYVTDRAPWFWKALWQATERRALAEPILQSIALLSSSSLRRIFQQTAPDLIVSTHPLVQSLALTTLQRMDVQIPYITVVTDLATVHPLWYHRQTSLCFVAGEEAYARGRSAGLSGEQLVRCGLPVRPAFLQPRGCQQALRQNLGLDPDRPVVLITGGGDGIGPLEAIAHSVAGRLAAGEGAVGQVVVICGRNAALRARLSAQRWPIPVSVQGFVDNMADWMFASDCMVTKAGPGAIAEALVVGLPVVLSGCIPGQEEGNIPYVLAGGAGVFCEDPAEIGGWVSSLLGPQRRQLEDMSARARRLAQPQATTQIVAEIVAFVDATHRSLPSTRSKPASTALALQRT